MKNHSVIILLFLSAAAVFFFAVRQRFSGSDAFPDRRGQSYVPTSNVRYSNPAPCRDGMHTVSTQRASVSTATGSSLPRGGTVASVSTAPGSSLPRGGTVASTRGTIASVSTAPGSTISHVASHRMVSPALHTTSQSTLHSYGGYATNTYQSTSSYSYKHTNNSANAYSVSTIPSLAINTTRYLNADIEQDHSVLATTYGTDRRYFFADAFNASERSIYTQTNSAVDRSALTTSRGEQSSIQGSSQKKIPSLYLAWVQKFAEHYGRQPNDMAELQAFIDWYMGSGLYGKPDPIDDGGVPQSLYLQWLDKYYEYYGYYPDSNEELQRFIDWWQGRGIYNEDDDAPLGDGLWLLLLLSICLLIIKHVEISTYRDIDITKHRHIETSK